jgi:type II secretory pathway component HofQ
MKTLAKLFVAYFGILILCAVTLPMNMAAQVTNAALPATTNLYIRTFKIDPNTFTVALRNVLGVQTGEIPVMARSFFSTLGVDLTAPGKSIFFTDGTSELFVRATEQDLDTIERVIQMLKLTAPQVRIKARFVEVEPDDANPQDFSPRIKTSSTRGSQNSDPTIATITGILTDTNFRITFHALQQRAGFEMLAEPEAVTTSGRQTQMRATGINQNLDFYDDMNPNGGSGRGNQF